MEKDDFVRSLTDVQIDILERVNEDMTAWRKALSVLNSPPPVKVGETPAEVIFKDDIMELLHYKNPGDGPPVLMIYALINQPYILDLQPGRSVVGSLLKNGIDVFLINWGDPDERHQFLKLEDYVNYFIDVCVDRVRQETGRDSIHVLGYCMGGTMSAMYTALHPEKVKSLTLMAAGLDFGGDSGILGFWANKEYFDVEKVAEAFGSCPGEFLDGAYQMLDPVGNLYSKFQNFASNVENEDFVEMFFRMEKWIHDGKQIPGPTFSKFVKELYQENRLINNEFYLGGRLVDLSKISMPVLNLVGDYDTLVPLESSLSFNDNISSDDTTVMRAPVGHIGLSVSSKMHKGIWHDVAEWIKERDSGISRPVMNIKGIGKKYAERLNEAGIETEQDLFEADIAFLSEKTDISDELLKKWKAQIGDDADE